MEDLRFLRPEMCGLGGEAAADDVVGGGCGGGGCMGGGEAGDERGGELRGVSNGEGGGGAHLDGGGWFLGVDELVLSRLG